MLVSTGSLRDPPYCFFVEATLLRDDNKVELPSQLDGTRTARLTNSVFATFKKLKIMSTSQQVGTKFRIKFALKIYRDNAFENVPDCVAISDPIEVFSHTLYLSRQGN